MQDLVRLLATAGPTLRCGASGEVVPLAAIPNLAVPPAPITGIVSGPGTGTMDISGKLLLLCSAMPMAVPSANGGCDED